jgi:uncharacterized membrane protein
MTVRKTGNILINTSIVFNALLLVLLLFENRVVIPAWLQVAGRMHPLILHFPIALVVMLTLFALYKIFKPNTNDGFFKTGLLMAGALAAFTALSGFFLSKETGYDEDAMAWHKWSGVVLSGLLLCWGLAYDLLQQNKLYKGLIAGSSLATVLLAGHHGANITHGENFLLAPVMQANARPPVLFEDALVFRDMVQPILEAKCMSCHNEKKAKGELVMTTEELLLRGGKNGKPWNLESPGFGLLMQRLHLPLQDKKHMPPTGKPQLADDEIFMIEQWLKKGASFTLDIASLKPTDTLYKMATAMFSNPATEEYNFDAANAATIEKLNVSNRSVYPLAMDMPALAVEFFGPSQYKPAQLKELLEVKDQVVSLNLNKMPIKDEEMSIIGQFKNLRKLNLSFTNITGKGLAALQPLEHLQQLSLSGTTLSANDLIQLQKLKKLSALHAWSTQVKPADHSLVQEKLSNTRIQWGFFGDTIIMQLNAPIIENEMQIISEPVDLKLKHFLPGVSIHYSLDGADPDSLQSPVHQPGIFLDKQALLKVKAFKQGWVSSNVTQLYFYKNKYKPDSVWALLPADEAYKGNGPSTLNDNVKGDNNFRSGKWLGYRFNAMDIVLRFNKPTPVSSITLSNLVDIASYIMPPQTVEVWGGTTMANMKLLKNIQPKQPEKEAPLYTEGFECTFTPQPVQFIRILAKPVAILPAWHRGKGDKAWIFLDEIFVN